MRLSRHRRNTIGAFNMTPMIDVVFLLLIFFMTVSHLSRTSELPLELPQATSGGKPPESISITINLESNGILVVADRTMSLEEVIQAVSRELDRVEQQPGRLRILVRCDRRAAGKHFNELARRLDELGIRQVNVAIEVSPAD